MYKELELAIDKEVENQIERDQELTMLQLLYNYDEEMENYEDPGEDD